MKIKMLETVTVPGKWTLGEGSVVELKAADANQLVRDGKAKKVAAPKEATKKK